MSKLARILTGILIAFALSSLVVYRLRLASSLRTATQDQSATRLVEETRIIEGADSSSRSGFENAHPDERR